MRKTLRPGAPATGTKIPRSSPPIEYGTPTKPAFYSLGGGRLFVGDVLESLRAMPPDSVDLIFGSPSYEGQRDYGGDVKLYHGEDWVNWMFSIYAEGVRVSRGGVCFVVEGFTAKFDYSATPILLMADMKRALQCGGCGKIQKFILCNCPGAKVKRGFRLRKPPIFARKGIMGSGGPDWWRNDYEFCPFVTKWGVTRLPFGDPTAIGHPPLYPPGGAPSHRKKDDSRVKGNYKPPALANPGNIRSHAVGGGHMGDNAAHKGEAPFPEGLARDFVLCFCPEGGTVYDPFIGTGTTAVVAAQHGRNFIGSDCRANQISMTRERLLSKGITNVQDS